MSPRRAAGGGDAAVPPPHDLRRRARLGLRGELQILLPAALLLLVVVSTFTFFSYRGALLALAEERQTEAARLARGVADRLVAPGGPATHPVAAAPLPAADWLANQAPGARGTGLLDATGSPLVTAGEQQPLPIPPLPPAHAHPFAAGPDASLPDVVAAWVPLVAPPSGAAGGGAALRYVRVDLPAATLAAQLRAIRYLGWLVLPVNTALVLLVLLFLRHLLTPYETLLARARALAPAAPDDRPDEDEASFLIATLERALEALGERQGGGADGGGSRADEDLAAIERTLAASLESGLLLLGRDGRVLSLNPPGAALLGAPPAAVGVPFAELLAPHPGMLGPVAAAIARAQPVKRQECTLQKPGGAPVTLGLSVHPLRRDDGAVRGYLVLFADLTEAHQRAQESRLTDRLATLGEMAAGVAHELRNSLATLRGYLTLIERRPDEESIADFLAEIRHESDHLQRVLEDFLAFARPGTARFQSVSMAALARRVASDPALGGIAVAVRAGGAPDRLLPAGTADAAEGPAATGRLRGDPQLIERALRNLLHNAAQAEREAGRDGPVELIVEEHPAGIEITVADRGPGVPAELRGRLFHPFATGRPGGVGLGLALAHRIMTLHGGRIRLEDREGGGTLAALFFPRDTFVTDGSNMGLDELAPPL